MTRVDARRYLQIALDSALAAGPIALEYFRKPIVVKRYSIFIAATGFPTGRSRRQCGPH